MIQQLKQQKHELQVQSQAEQARARTTETFSQSVLSNLPCGVLVFGTNGLVKTSNPAAKAILGFASTTGMGVEDIFRGAEVHAEGRSDRAEHRYFATKRSAKQGTRQLVSPAGGLVLRLGSDLRQVEAAYETPAGEPRFIAVRISPVPAADGELLGVACLISDRSELQQIRRQQELHGEISAEMALQLRTSLATISGYAQQLVSHRDPELAKQLATDIAEEARLLDRTLGGFLTEKRAAKGAAAGATD